MHGLINRAIQGFVQDTYGPAVWTDVLRRAELDLAGFEAMLGYPDEQSYRVLAELEGVLDRPLPGILEDIGTYLVSDPKMERLRRLLRFGGDTFEEFLLSLGDLPEWARLAVPDLDLPEITRDDAGPGRFRLRCHGEREGWGHVLIGVLRALADDFGTLVFLEHRGTGAGSEGVAAGIAPGEEIEVTVLERRFARGRDFELAAEVG